MQRCDPQPEGKEGKRASILIAVAPIDEASCSCCVVPAGTALSSPIDMQPALAPPPGARARACLRLHLTGLTVRADLRPPASYRLRLALHAVALTARELGGAAPPAPPLLELVPPRAKPL